MLAPVTLLDTFTRIVADSWGTSDSAHAWSGTNSSYDVDGSSGTIVVGASSTYRSAYIDLSAHDIPNQGTSEVLMLTKWTGSESYPTTDFGPALSRSSSTTFYAASLQGNYGELAIICYVKGTRYELSRVGKSITKNTWYWVRFRRDGSGLKLKVWERDKKEPSSWTLTSKLFDGSNPPISGDMGVYCRGLASTYTISVDSFYGYTLEDEYAVLPITDNFERDVDEGWGISGSGHVWEGNFAQDPEVYVLGRQGGVTDPSAGYAFSSPPDTAERVGFIGDSISGDSEIYARVEVNTALGNTWANIGLHGSYQTDDGTLQYKGYAVQFKSNATDIKLVKKTSFTSAPSTIATSGAITAIAANTIYGLRLQRVGTTLRARIWLDGGAEPGTWDVSVTDASISSGRFFIETEQSVAATKTIKVHSIEAGVPTPATTQYTATGTLVTTSVSDTSISFQSNFTQDSNSNNSIDVKYRKTTVGSWTDNTNIPTRNAANYTFTISGLEPNTSYYVRVKYTDADNVVGTNPIIGTFTTAQQGVTTSTLSVTAIGATTATVEQLYLGDTNDNSTATLDYRTTTSETQFVSDGFGGVQGIELSTHTAELGSTWIKHSMSTADIFLTLTRLYQKSVAVGDKSLYYNNQAPSSVVYDVCADLYATELEGKIGLAARINTAANTAYIAYYNALANTFEIAKYISGTLTVLDTKIANVIKGDVYSLRFIVNDAYKALIVDNIEVCRTTDNVITAAGKAGIFIESTTDAAPTRTTKSMLDDFFASYRTGAVSWTSFGAMTASRPSKKFTASLTGLTTDAVYEFRTTLADANGVQGFNPQSVTAMTTGQSVQLSSLVAVGFQNTITLDTVYLFDTNNNSSLSVQYRSNMSTIWTSAPSSWTTVDRPTKKFTTTLINLKPNTTYEMKVTITDPNGIIEGGKSSLKVAESTIQSPLEVVRQDTQYLWKIYSPQDEYICTWNDAGVPEFGFHENGGVSDLEVSLPRPMAAVGRLKDGIAFQNRVDIWCIDPTSDGFGLNLLVDNEFELGSWTLGTNAVVGGKSGPDDSKALWLTASNTVYTTRSSPILLRNVESIIDGNKDAEPVPMVVKGIAKAIGGKLRMFVEAYDAEEIKIDESDDVAETIGSGWQTIRLEYLPPRNTHYIRIAVENSGSGLMYLDKVSVQAKEILIYRGRIESYTPQVDEKGERIEVSILGLASLLSDDYITFLQFVAIQPANDATHARENLGPVDPAEMLRIIIDTARKQNPFFSLYYTAESIHNTGELAEYTFRNKQLRACFDKVREFCPPDWHYFVESDGLVWLRGPEHGSTHILRRGVEIMNLSIERSIRNLKNYIIVKGRQDEDGSETDGNKTILYETFDQASIDKYGKRVLYINDANVTTPKTAELMGDGRLVEYNREEQRVKANVPDDKNLAFTNQTFKGYNTLSFRPGDLVILLDPINGPEETYWNSLVWNEDRWNFEDQFSPLPTPVPIKTINFHGTYADVEMSERQPSGVSDFGRLYRWMQKQNSDSGENT